LDLGERKLQEAGEDSIRRSFDLYASPNINTVTKPRRMRLAGHVAHWGEMRNAYNIFIGKPKEKRQLRRLRHK
jgi:hypothetical protein